MKPEKNLNLLNFGCLTDKHEHGKDSYTKTGDDCCESNMSGLSYFVIRIQSLIFKN